MATSYAAFRKGMMGPKRRLKRWRGVATRHEKRAVDYRAMVLIASLMVRLPS